MSVNEKISLRSGAVRQYVWVTVRGGGGGGEGEQRRE